MLTKKSMMALALSAVAFGAAKAQVKDVSLKLSPLGEYQWWNKNINLENNVFYGLRAGFGFGPFFELHAIAEKSADIKGALKSSNWNIDKKYLDKVPGAKVSITRIGGELKVNLLGGAVVSPYVLGGAGVQYFKYDPFKEGLDDAKDKEQQVYLSLGAGLKFRLSDRIGLSVEGRDVIFNMDKTNPYFNPMYTKKNRKLHNFAAMASLNIYLGGKTYDNANAFGRKARYAFNSGFVRGLKFVLEPSVASVHFKDSKLFPKDQWFMGGAAGFDFTSLLGIRGFYYQATKTPNKFEFNYNKDLSMYGGEIIARLNQPRGIVPYLSIGAGVLHIADTYRNPAIVAKYNKNNLFGRFGAGIEVPLSKYFSVFGSANAMLMAEPGLDAGDIARPSQVHTNWMYTGGLRINIGKPAKSVSELYSERVDEIRQEQNERVNALRAAYEKRLKTVNAQLDEAIDAKDSLKVVALLAQKEALSKNEANDVKKIIVQAPQPKQQEACKEKCKTNEAPVQTTINPKDMMTAEEFEQLVERVVAKVRAQQKLSSCNLSDADMNVVLAALNGGNRANTVCPRTNQKTTELLNQLRSMILNVNNKVNSLSQKLNAQSNNMPQTTAPAAPAAVAPAPVAPTTTIIQQPAAPAEVLSPSVAPATAVVAANPMLRFNTASLYTAGNFGEAFAWNFGVRANMQISNTNLDFMPELYFGVGKNTSFGLSGNVIYNIKTAWGKIINPYVGLGLGLFNNKTTTLGTNVILGTSLNIFHGNLFVDYSIRQLFKNNQLAVGYRFRF